MFQTLSPDCLARILESLNVKKALSTGWGRELVLKKCFVSLLCLGGKELGVPLEPRGILFLVTGNILWVSPSLPLDFFLFQSYLSHFSSLIFLTCL